MLSPFISSCDDHFYHDGTAAVKLKSLMYNGYCILRGKLVIDRNTKSPKLNVKNWECGVLIPVVAKTKTEAPVAVATTAAVPNIKSGEINESGRSSGKVEEKQEQEKKKEQIVPTPLPGAQMKVFEGVVPVPMEVPGKRIAAGRNPWFYTEA